MISPSAGSRLGARQPLSYRLRLRRRKARRRKQFLLKRAPRGLMNHHSHEPAEADREKRAGPPVCRLRSAQGTTGPAGGWPMVRSSAAARSASTRHCAASCRYSSCNVPSTAVRAFASSSSARATQLSWLIISNAYDVSRDRQLIEIKRKTRPNAQCPHHRRPAGSRPVSLYAAIPPDPAKGALRIRREIRSNN